MVDHIFADGLAGVSIIGPTVRLDFFCFSPTEKDVHGQPKPMLQYRLVLPGNAFAQLAGKLQEAAESITKLGKESLAKADADQTPNRRPESSTASGSKSLFP